MSSDRAPGDEWLDRRACHSTPVSVFYPSRGSGPNAYARARLVCGACPVRKECLKMAIEFEWGSSPQRREGMFGGKTPLERAKIELAWIEREEAKR